MIEVPLRSDPIKHKFDESAGAMVIDRFLYTTILCRCTTAPCHVSTCWPSVFASTLRNARVPPPG